jgi:D-3-phosphoglycerate dehydrogenase / 2-oxoglutarate reductase
MKLDTCLMLKCARGGIVDEAALLDSLNNGHCGGAGLDVFEEVILLL